MVGQTVDMTVLERDCQNAAQNIRADYGGAENDGGFPRGTDSPVQHQHQHTQCNMQQQILSMLAAKIRAGMNTSRRRLECRLLSIKEPRLLPKAGVLQQARHRSDQSKRRIAVWEGT